MPSSAGSSRTSTNAQPSHIAHDQMLTSQHPVFGSISDMLKTAPHSEVSEETFGVSGEELW